MDIWVKKLNMMPLNKGLKRHGDSIENKIIFYETFLQQSDKLIQQYNREKEYELPTLISDNEYIELNKLRKQAIIDIQILKNQN